MLVAVCGQRLVIRRLALVVSMLAIVGTTFGCASSAGDERASEDAVVGQQSRPLLVAADPYFSANRANLVPNPSFEFEGEQQWVSWNTSQPAQRVDTLSYSGHHSIKLSDSSTTNSAGVVTQRVAAVPGRAYTASAWVQRSSTGSASIYLQFHDGLGAGTSDRIAAVSASINQGSGSWKTGLVSAIAPPGTRYVDVLVYSNLARTGVFFVDDISLRAQENLVSNGDFQVVDKTDSSRPASWSAWRDTDYSRVANSSFNGGSALAWSDAAGAGSQGAVSERFAVFPGQTITVTGRALYTGSRPNLYLRFFGSRTSTTVVEQRLVTFPSGSGWELASLTKEVPVGAEFAEVLAYSCGDCEGSYKVDDIRVSSAKNLLLNGDFEDTASPEWTGSFSSSTFEVSGGRSIRFEDTSTSSGVAVRSLPLPIIAGRSYELTGSVYASTGDGPADDDCKVWLAIEFYPSMKRASSTAERLSLAKTGPTESFASLTCAEHGARWVSRKLYLQPFPDDEARYPITIQNAGFNPINGGDTLALLDEPAPLSLSDVEAAFGIDGNDWLQVYGNWFVGHQPEQRARIEVYRRNYAFYNLQTSRCDSLASVSSNSEAFFYVDNLLGLP